MSAAKLLSAAAATLVLMTTCASAACLQAPLDGHKVEGFPRLSVTWAPDSNLHLEVRLPQTTPSARPSTVSFFDADPATPPSVTMSWPAVPTFDAAACESVYALTAPLASVKTGAAPVDESTPDMYSFVFTVEVSWSDVVSVYDTDGAPVPNLNTTRDSTSHLTFTVNIQKRVAVTSNVSVTSPVPMYALVSKMAVAYDPVTFAPYLSLAIQTRIDSLYVVDNTTANVTRVYGQVTGATRVPPVWEEARWDEGGVLVQILDTDLGLSAAACKLAPPDAFELCFDVKLVADPSRVWPSCIMVRMDGSEAWCEQTFRTVSLVGAQDNFRSAWATPAAIYFPGETVFAAARVWTAGAVLSIDSVSISSVAFEEVPSGAPIAATPTLVGTCPNASYHACFSVVVAAGLKNNTVYNLATTLLVRLGGLPLAKRSSYISAQEIKLNSLVTIRSGSRPPAAAAAPADSPSLLGVPSFVYGLLAGLGGLAALGVVLSVVVLGLFVAWRRSIRSAASSASAN